MEKIKPDLKKKGKEKEKNIIIKPVFSCQGSCNDCKDKNCFTI